MVGECEHVSHKCSPLVTRNLQLHELHFEEKSQL